MPKKGKDEGSNSLEWKPDKRAKEVKNANKELTVSFYDFLKNNTNNTVYKGTLGSGDAFNREIDRINWISSTFDSLCEDMESIGVYLACQQFNVPCIGIRIISNNEIIGEELDEDQAIYLQKLLIDFIRSR